MPKVPKTLLDKIIVDKALDRASRLRNQMLERGMTPSEVQGFEEELVENLNPIVKRWKPMMRRGPVGARDILNTGKFKNQFETGTSGGAYSLERRRNLSNRYFAEPEDDTFREKYGYLKRPKKYGFDSVGGYGHYEFRFKPVVRKRMTLNNGDTLDDFRWEDSPTPLVPGMEDTYINFVGRPEADYNQSYWPSEIQLYKRRLARLKEELAPHNRAGYFETQYHGPLTLEDIEGLRTPFVNLEPIGSEIEDPMKELLMNSSDRYDFPVYNWIDKCIYNCR